MVFIQWLEELAPQHSFITDGNEAAVKSSKSSQVKQLKSSQVKQVIISSTKSTQVKMDDARAKRGQQKTELQELTNEARDLLQTKADGGKQDDILIRINESIDKFKNLHVELMSYVDNEEEKNTEQVYYEDVIKAIKDTTDMLSKHRFAESAIAQAAALLPLLALKLRRKRQHWWQKPRC